MKMRTIAAALTMACAAGSVMAAGFVNGGFEAGDMSGWAIGGGYRGGANYNPLDPANFLSGGAAYNAGIAGSHSAIISAGTVDPHVGALLGSTVYSGNYSLRVEDTTYGGYASVASQTVTNYTDTDIFFAWKAVLEGAHGVRDAASMVISLVDLTTSTELIRREYNASTSGGGGGSIFSQSGGDYYTPQWQIEQLTIGSALSGHDFMLSVLAADCQPTGHYGYIYLDGFGAVIPPGGNVPEPATLALAGLALAGGAFARRRNKKQA